MFLSGARTVHTDKNGKERTRNTLGRLQVDLTVLFYFYVSETPNVMVIARDKLGHV